MMSENIIVDDSMNVADMCGQCFGISRLTFVHKMFNFYLIQYGHKFVVCFIVWTRHKTNNKNNQDLRKDSDGASRGYVQNNNK